jgi:streptomycin 6-kinase
MVGEFFQQSLRTRLIDAKVVFDAPRYIPPPPPPEPEPAPGLAPLVDWFRELFPTPR